jgi:hypothetical protein
MPSSRAVLTTPGVTGGTDAISFIYNLLVQATGNVGTVGIESGFSMGYFTCGSSVLNTTQYDPVSNAMYTTVCRENGVVGQVLFKDTYYFTPVDAQTYATSLATGRCAALTDPIATTVADLPPYSCSRTIHPSFLACFATAAANTQLLFQVLVFVSALALSKLAARYPPKHSLRGEAAPNAAPVSIEMSGISTSASASTYAGTGTYVHDIENPMVR